MKRLLPLALGLVACAASPVSTVKDTPTPISTAQPDAAQAPPLVEIASSEAPRSLPVSGDERGRIFPTRPFAPDCAEARGTVTNHNYHSRTLGYSLFYNVYLPPCYDEAADDYPVLYLLHGKSFIEDEWDRLGADEAADQRIAVGGAPFIIIMPRGGANTYFGEGLVNDLMPHVEAEYRIRRDRVHRAIGGLSRGAGWAIYLGLKRPDLFGAIGAHSPAIQYVHAPEIDDLLDALPADEIPRLYIDIGDNDSLIGNTKWFMAMLDARHIPYEFHLNTGKHDEAYWSAHTPEYIEFYSKEW